MKRTILGGFLVAVFCIGVSAQGPGQAKQAELQNALKGKVVTVKIDMPAISKGVVVNAGKQNPIDGGKYQKRLQAFGTAITSGEMAEVTRISVSDDEISFELNGGGAPEWIFRNPGRAAFIAVQDASREWRARDRVSSYGPVSAQQGASGPVAPPDNGYARSTVNYESSIRQRESVASQMGSNTDPGEVSKVAAKMGSRFVIKFGKNGTANVTPDEVMKILEDCVAF